MPQPEKEEARDKLDFTGERFVPHQTDPLLALEHYHRYYFASRFAQGKRILDFGCGEGYGSALLSTQANAVIGIDRDEATIQHARAKYSSIPNLRFKTGRCEENPGEEGAFDMIVGFELLEHLDPGQQPVFLGNVLKLLKEDGLFIVSSPERNEYAAAYQTRNEFHKGEMTLTELRAFLSTRFKHVHLCGQRILSLSTMWELNGRKDAQFHLRCRKDLLEELPDGQGFSKPLYLIALCSNTQLPEKVFGESNSFYLDVSNSGQADDFSRWALQLNAEAQKNREMTQDLQEQLEERAAWALSLDEEVAKLRNELEGRTRWAVSLESEVANEREHLKLFEAERQQLAAITSSTVYRLLSRIKLLPKWPG